MVCRSGVRCQPRRGLALVEFSLFALFLAGLVIGVWEVGRMIQIQQILNNAAREGGRQASTGQLSATGVQTIVQNYLNNALPSAGVSNPTAVATYAYNHCTVTNLDYPKTDSSVTPPKSNDPTDPTKALQLDRLQVRVTIRLADVRWIDLYLISDANTNLVATSVWPSVRDRDYPTPVDPPID